MSGWGRQCADNQLTLGFPENENGNSGARTRKKRREACLFKDWIWQAKVLLYDALTPSNKGAAFAPTCNVSRLDGGSTSPGQITACPWVLQVQGLGLGGVTVELRRGREREHARRGFRHQGGKQKTCGWVQWSGKCCDGNLLGGKGKPSVAGVETHSEGKMFGFFTAGLNTGFRSRIQRRQ